MKKYFFALFLIPVLTLAAPIHFDAQRGRLKKIQRYIEKKGVDVNLPLPKTLETPLILAAGSNEPIPEILTYLISKGADVNAAAADGWTALMSSAQRNFTNNIVLLLQAGADPARSTKFGENALGIAVRYGSLEAAELLLNAAPSLANKTSQNGVTPLMTAAQNEKAGLVKLLITGGADVNIKDNRGYTALMRINLYGGTEIADALLQAGADPNHIGEKGWTPLMEAAAKNRADIVDLLLQAGAKPSKTDTFGRTALDVAEKNNAVETAEVLKNYLKK